MTGARWASRLLLGSMLIATIQPAYAQRGGDFTRQETLDAGPMTGFTGLFDARVAPDRGIVLDAPWLNIEYGVTENLTVGTNGWSYLPLTGGFPGGLVSARYQIYARPDLAVAVTGYGSYLGGHESALDLLAGSATATWQITPRNTLNGGAGVLRLGISSENAELGYSERSQFSGLIVAGSVQTFLAPWLGTDLAVFGFPLLAGRMETTFVATRFDLTSSPLSRRFMLRGLFRIKPGRTWLLSAGGFLFEGPDSSALFLPWLSVAKHW